MDKRTRLRSEDSPISETPKTDFRFVILEADWREYLAGRVLKADADMQSALSTEGVPHRDATEQERAIAGIG